MEKEELMKYSALTALLLMLVGSSAAYDQGSPYTVTMQFIVPSDTTFAASLAGGETTIRFQPATANSVSVQATSQNNATGLPILNITNNGNVNLNVTVNLTSAKPSWVVLKAFNTGAYASAQTYGTTTAELNLTGWNNIAVGTNASVYLWADFTSAAGGTTARTFEANAWQAN
jgi:hypothetical protein